MGTGKLPDAFELWEMNARRNGLFAFPVIAVAYVVRWIRFLLGRLLDVFAAHKEERDE